MKSSRVAGTGQKDGVSELCVVRLQLHHTVHVWRLSDHLVAVVIREDLDYLPLLIGCEYVEKDGRISSEPDIQNSP